MDALSQLLKTKRNDLRLSLRSAAEMIGISHTYLDKLEKGVDSRTGVCNKPTPDTLKLISTAYNINYTDLMECCNYISSCKKSPSFHYSNDIEELLEIVNRFNSHEIRNLILYAKFLDQNKAILK